MAPFNLKSDYVQRNNTQERDRSNYWNEIRVRASGDFQYYVYLYAQRLLTYRMIESVMDIGSGPGTKINELFADQVRDIVLVDHPTTEELCRQHCPSASFVGCDLELSELNLQRPFNLIICADVLEHLVNPNRCIDMIKRHMNDQSILVASTPDRDILRGPQCNESVHDDHIREWSHSEFNAYIRSRKLKIIDSFFSPHIKQPGSAIIDFENGFHNCSEPLACYTIVSRLDSGSKR